MLYNNVPSPHTPYPTSPLISSPAWVPNTTVWFLCHPEIRVHEEVLTLVQLILDQAEQSLASSWKVLLDNFTW